MFSDLKTTDVRARIEPKIKSRASRGLAECGLTLSDAIRMFLRQVVLHQGLPFDVKTPNAKTVVAMKETRAIRKARFATAQELFAALEKTSTTKTRRSAKKKRRLPSSY
jgi:DNA-damage-inducible protein J